MPEDEWDDYEVDVEDDPDACRDMLDDPAREDFA
jgi:hypothetical protein